MRLLIAFAAMLALSACAGGSPAAKKYEGVYVSLGDSVAAGNGSSDKASTSFAALLATDEGVPLVNLAVSGYTTTDVIAKELPQIEAEVAGRRVAFITISVGGNDLAALIPNATCQQDPLPASCPLDEALTGVDGRLQSILDGLRVRYPDAPIVLLMYPNFFSGTGHVFEAPAARVLPRLDEVIARVAARNSHAAAADAAPPFEGKGATLTHVLDSKFDPHPTDAGHRLIADAFVAALKRVT